MEVGNLNKVVVFKSNTPTAKGAGSADGYATLLTTRGHLKKNSGGRGFAFAELSENNSYTLTVRFETALETALSPSVKVEIESRTYTVASWEKMGEKRFYYKIQLNEKR